MDSKNLPEVSILDLTNILKTTAASGEAAELEIGLQKSG